MTTMTDTPRIYVASLADYSAGILHGTWIDLDESTTVEDVQEQVTAMMRKSPSPEVRMDPTGHDYAIHDYEGFAGVGIHEHAPIDQVVSLAENLHEHGPAWAAYVAHVGEGYADSEGFEESYCGEWNSEEEYARDLAWSTGIVPDDNRATALYFDWDAFTRDLFLGDYWSERSPHGGVYVFRAV